MLGRKRRVVADEAQELDGSGWLEGVSVLNGNVVMQGIFIVQEVKAGDAERGDVIGHGALAADDAEQSVRGDVVTQRDGQAQKLAQGDVDIGVWIFVPEWTVGMGQDAVAGKEADRLIERELVQFNLMEDGQSQRGFEDGLHGRRGVSIEVAIERGAGQRAGYRDFAFGVVGNRLQLRLKRRRMTGSLSEGAGCAGDENYCWKQDGKESE